MFRTHTRACGASKDSVSQAMSSSSFSSHLRATLSLGLPLIGAHLAQVLVTITDTLMLGWYSVEALAAGVLGSSFFFILFIAGSGFAWALAAPVAAAFAQGDARQVRRISRMGLWIGALVAFLSYPIFWQSAFLLKFLQQQPEIADAAQSYLRIVGFGLLPALIVASLRSTLSGLERTRIVLLATLLGAAVNIALNWVLIFGNLGAPELGLEGAALASISVHLVMAVILAVYSTYAPGLREYEFFSRLYKPDWAAFGDLFRLGWPISLTLLAEVGLFYAAALMMGALGKIPLAAHGIAMQITSATFMVHVGLSAAATVRVGAAYGRRNLAEVALATQAALLLSAVFVVVTVIAFLTVPFPLIGAFLGPDEPLRPEILTLGVLLLAFASLFQLFDAMQVMTLGALRGLQDTKWPMIFAWIGYWGIGVPLAATLTFQLDWGPQGVWLGLSMGLAVAGVLLYVRLLRLLRRPFAPLSDVVCASNSQT